MEPTTGYGKEFKEWLKSEAGQNTLEKVKQKSRDAKKEKRESARRLLKILRRP